MTPERRAELRPFPERCTHAEIRELLIESAGIRDALKGVLPRVVCPAGCRHGDVMQGQMCLPNGCLTCSGRGTIDPVDGPETTLELVERVKATLISERRYDRPLTEKMDGDLTKEDLWRTVRRRDMQLANAVQLMNKKDAERDRIAEETRELAAALCDAEGKSRQERAEQCRSDGFMEGEARIQDHKAIKAFALASAIRAMPLPGPPQEKGA